MPGFEVNCGRNKVAIKNRWFGISMILALPSSKPEILRFPSLKSFLYFSFKP
jgi:hypothetical protein